MLLAFLNSYPIQRTYHRQQPWKAFLQGCVMQIRWLQIVRQLVALITEKCWGNSWMLVTAGTLNEWLLFSLPIPFNLFDWQSRSISILICSTKRTKNRLLLELLFYSHKSTLFLHRIPMGQEANTIKKEWTSTAGLLMNWFVWNNVLGGTDRNFLQSYI